MRLVVKARESKREQNELKNPMHSFSLYREKLGIVLADIIVLIRHLRKLEEIGKTIDMDLHLLSNSTLSLLEWCMEEHDSIKPDVKQPDKCNKIFKPDYESYLVEKRNAYSADHLLSYLQQLAVLQRLAVPLLSIIQNYIGDDLDDALILFGFLIEEPIVKDIITWIKRYDRFNDKREDVELSRYLSILGKSNQNDVTPYLTSFFTRHGMPQIISIFVNDFQRIITIQGFTVKSSVLCMAITSMTRVAPDWLKQYYGQPLPIIKFIFGRISDQATLASVRPIGWRLETSFKYKYHDRVYKPDRELDSSPLILAVEYRSDPEVINFLLADQRVLAEINAKDSHGMTAIAWAAGSFEYEKVRMLLKAKADPTIVNGSTIEAARKMICPVDYERGDGIKILDILCQAREEYRLEKRRQQYKIDQFNTIKEQRNGYSFLQKRICREYFTNQFAECRTYSEIYKAYKEHNNASYTNQDRWPMFRKSPYNSTKTHLLTVALEAIIRLAKRFYIMPNIREIFQLLLIIKETQVDKTLEPLIKEISTLIPNLKVDKTDESPTPGSSTVFNETYCQLS